MTTDYLPHGTALEGTKLIHIANGQHLGNIGTTTLGGITRYDASAYLPDQDIYLFCGSFHDSKRTAAFAILRRLELI